MDAIGGALRELERAGYIVRHQMRDRQGRISDTEYVIYEQPQPKNPDTPQPDTAAPDPENPYLDKPDTEKPAELNIETVSYTHLSILSEYGRGHDSALASIAIPARYGVTEKKLLEKGVAVTVHEGHLPEQDTVIRAACPYELCIRDRRATKSCAPVPLKSGSSRLSHRAS